LNPRAHKNSNKMHLNMNAINVLFDFINFLNGSQI
jgi:hypothetical protein